LGNLTNTSNLISKMNPRPDGNNKKKILELKFPPIFLKALSSLFFIFLFQQNYSKVLANVFRDSIYKAFGKCDLSSISLYFSHKKNIISKKSFLSFTNKKHVHGKSAIFNIFVLFCLHLLNLGKFQLCIIVQVEHFELKIPYCLFQKVSKARSNVFLS
jgi:hypothetical protein